MPISLEDLWFTQAQLKRLEQVPDIARSLREGWPMRQPIELFQCPDFEVEIGNGHHRVAAVFISGRKHLEDGEYILIQDKPWRRRVAKVNVIVPQLIQGLRYD